MANLSRTRTRLLLVSPPILYTPRLWGSRLPSKPHLHSLAGFVRDVAEVKIIDLELALGAPRDLESIDEYLAGLEQHLDLVNLDLVGISCWTSFHYQGTLEVARFIRTRAPKLPVVVGGHHVGAMPEDFTNPADGFDFIVMGDGEHELRSLCEERPKRPLRPKVVAGRRFALSDPGHIDWTTYPWHDQESRIMWLNLHRGCPHQCAFCVGRSPTSAYGVEQALDLLEWLETHRGPRMICLADPIFGLNPSWTRAFLEGLEQRSISARFWAETRADLPDPALLDQLMKLGFWLDFGLDTGSPTMVRAMNKASSAEDYLVTARRNLRHADAIGLPHLVYLLFNFPGETPDTARESMTFVEALAQGDGTLSAMAAAQSFFVLPGTDAHRRRDEYRQKWGTRYQHPSWWRETGDQLQMAMDIIPSAAFVDRSDQLGSWESWQSELNRAWSPRRPPEVRKLFWEMFG